MYVKNRCTHWPCALQVCVLLSLHLGSGQDSTGPGSGCPCLQAGQARPNCRAAVSCNLVFRTSRVGSRLQGKGNRSSGTPQCLLSCRHTLYTNRITPRKEKWLYLLFLQESLLVKNCSYSKCWITTIQINSTSYLTESGLEHWTPVGWDPAPHQAQSSTGRRAKVWAWVQWLSSVRSRSASVGVSWIYYCKRICQ